MLKKIKLKNFMSHKSTEFELVQGVNVLTGPNNSGKSAVISALQLLADLPVKEGDYMVRHGTSESAVTVETGEGDVLTWQRKNSAMSLTINGDKDIRLQNNRDHYLEKLHKHLKLPKVSGNESKQDFDIHFANQKEPIFLINEPPSRAALFFASSSDAGRLFEVRDKYKDLVKVKRKEQQAAKVTLEQQNKILAGLAPLDDIEELMKFVQDTYKQFPKDQEILRLSTTMLQELKTYTLQYKNISSRHQVMQKLLQPPHLEDSDKLDQHRKALMRETDRFSNSTYQQKALSELTQPPELQLTKELAKQLHDLRHAEKNRLKLEKMQELLAEIKPRPEIEDTERLTILLKAMHEHSLTITKLSSQQTHFASVGSPPLIENEFLLSSFLNNLHKTILCEISLRARVKNLAQLTTIPKVDDLPRIELEKYLKNHSLQSGNVQKLTTQLQKADFELRQWVDQHPSCPTCGGDLNVEKLQGRVCHG